MGRRRPLECRWQWRRIWNDADVGAGFCAEQAKWRDHAGEADGQDRKPVTGMSRAGMRYQQERDCNQQCQRSDPKPYPLLVDLGHLFAQSVPAVKRICRKWLIGIKSEAPGWLAEGLCVRSQSSLVAEEQDAGCFLFASTLF
jgi:hypothetical protein